MDKGLWKNGNHLSHSPFFLCFFSDGNHYAPVSSRTEKRGGMGAKTSGYNETQSREISCHHGIATFRSEISPLRSAVLEMTMPAGS